MGINAMFRMELRSNGQLIGHTNFLGMSSDVTGDWTYEPEQRLFTAHTVSRTLGQTQSEEIKLWITSREGNVFRGHGSAYQAFTLTRLD